MLRCKGCLIDKIEADFSRDSKAKSGHFYKCKSCTRKHRRAYYLSRQAFEKERAIEYYNVNKEKQRSYNKEYLRLHKGEVNARIAKRNALKKKAMPVWADQSAIERFYKQASDLSKQTGLKYEVDHIVPLQNHLVCGLHVPANLQVITANENRKKKNKFNQGF
jgi:hypothetical protein